MLVLQKNILLQQEYYREVNTAFQSSKIGSATEQMKMVSDPKQHLFQRKEWTLPDGYTLVLIQGILTYMGIDKPAPEWPFFPPADLHPNLFEIAPEIERVPLIIIVGNQQKKHSDDGET